LIYPIPSYGQIGSLPEELREVALKSGCSEVKRFFDRPGMVNPPYVYGYLPGPKENSAAFWCEKKENDKEIFLLNFFFKGEIPEEYICSQSIQRKTGYPGGLSVYKDRDTTLEFFHYLNDPKRKPPANEKLTHNGILSEYDGVGLLFYCYKGEWIVRITH
jgi:hypothetical protein